MAGYVPIPVGDVFVLSVQLQIDYFPSRKQSQSKLLHPTDIRSESQCCADKTILNKVTFGKQDGLPALALTMPNFR